jgi:hypothetical protein
VHAKGELFDREYGGLEGIVDLPLEGATVDEIEALVQLGQRRDVRAANRRRALEQLDIAHRIAELLDTVGIDRPDGLRDRLGALRDAAAATA